MWIKNKISKYKIIQFIGGNIDINIILILTLFTLPENIKENVKMHYMGVKNMRMSKMVPTFEYLNFRIVTFALFN